MHAGRKYREVVVEHELVDVIQHKVDVETGLCHAGGNNIRGVCVTLDYVCEGRHEFSHQFVFHKGETIKTVCGIDQSPGDRPKTVWRD